MKPKVSIIIPVYNSENYLDKCISSILKQTLNGIEIILVDDGSTDKSEVICKKYKDSDNRVKFVRKKNGGVSSARNCGVSIAEGEFITFVDSDDYIESNMCEKLYTSAIENKCDVIFSGMKSVNNKVISYIFTDETKIYSKEEACKLFFFDKEPFSPNYACGKLIKKTVCEKIKFREDIFLMEDALYCMELFLNCTSNIMFLNEYLYNYVQRSGSASKHFNKKRITSYYALDELLNIARTMNKLYEMKFLKVYSKLILGILQDIIYFDFEGNKCEYLKISKALNKEYFKNMKCKSIGSKNKIHLTVLKISPMIYKWILKRL
nr:glycosyltransferase family 2 protein [uncultured Clostridium sp.]